MVEDRVEIGDGGVITVQEHPQRMSVVVVMPSGDAVEMSPEEARKVVTAMIRACIAIESSPDYKPCAFSDVHDHSTCRAVPILAREEPDGPHGFIQWKGTDVCMDLYCECGCHWHIDADFAYFTRCPRCGASYKVMPFVYLCRVSDAEADAGPFRTEDFDEAIHGPRCAPQGGA